MDISKFLLSSYVFPTSDSGYKRKLCGLTEEDDPRHCSDGTTPSRVENLLTNDIIEMLFSFLLIEKILIFVLNML